MASAPPTRSLLKAGADDARRYWLDEGRAEGGFVREVDYAANARGLDPMFAGLRIIDCDTHYTEPPNLWLDNAPAGLKDKMPRVERHGDIDKWVCMGRDFGSMGGNVIGRDKNKLLGRLAYRNYDQIAPGSYDLEERLKDMDDMGIWGQVCFQNGGVTQAGSLVALNDEAVAIAITRIFNDACKDRMDRSAGRVNCMATLPYWDRGLMNAELRRVVDLGLKGIVLPDRPERLSEGYLAEGGGINPFWEEVFDTCNATGLAINFHLNASLDAESAMWDHLGFDQRLPLSALIHHIGCATTMTNFMVTGVLDKYEDLKIGLIESGAGWVPFWLEGLEHQLDEFRTLINRGLKRRPKEYFARNFWVSFWFETASVTRLLDEIGADRLMFQTDYPHPTSLYPGVQDKLVSVLKDVDPARHQLILQDNAARLFNLDL
ncbi:MAG TPA: amidohydrolase family protein, partial [Novosphingobium sp.]|nr:amidohydrolase family protein [Novosphingobium sp.]